MSGDIPLDRGDGLVRAARLAIARAKCRGSDEVTPDDLLAGLLHAIARFGIVLIGTLTIDLEAMGEDALNEADAAGPKVAYSSSAASLFDRAASEAKKDRSPRIEPVHMLAAFAREENGLMGRLKRTYGFDDAEWRAALARGHPSVSSRPDRAEPRAPAVQELLSPDEAAEFLGVHTQTVRGYIRSGKLTAHRIAGERAVRIRRQDLLDLLEPYEPD